MTTLSDSLHGPESATAYLGLAPFLRMSVAGTPFLNIGQELLVRAAQRPDDPSLWMNLATVMLCLGRREEGLQIQTQALEMRRLYHLPAAQQPAGFRLLVLVVPGDLAANTPIDCLLEASDIDLDFCYVGADGSLPEELPEHDAVLVGISVADQWQGLLATLERTLAGWPKPIINAPSGILATERDRVSVCLRDAPGLMVPPTRRASRGVLLEMAAGEGRLSERLPRCDFPVILRPVGSHAGRDLDRVDAPEGLSEYLARVPYEEFFISPFVDYSGADGRFRKVRIALIDGEAFVCHMAVSNHWMVHYVSADMYQDAARRAEEAAFMADFDAFRVRHGRALEAVRQAIGLDYLQIDCAQTRDGRLLIFEIDHAMVVHAMDPVDLFPYKQPHMQKVRDALRGFLFRLKADAAARGPG
jgi:glutathione synthase/RimK-type ligase-like ATP-grasp enzyme